MTHLAVLLLLTLFLAPVAWGSETNSGELDEFIPPGLLEPNFDVERIEKALRATLEKEESSNEIRAFGIMSTIEGVWKTKALLVSLSLEKLLSPDELKTFRQDYVDWQKSVEEAQTKASQERSGSPPSDYSMLKQRMEISVRCLKELVTELECRIQKKDDERLEKVMKRLENGEIDLGPRLGPPRE